MDSSSDDDWGMFSDSDDETFITPTEHEYRTSGPAGFCSGCHRRLLKCANHATYGVDCLGKNLDRKIADQYAQDLARQNDEMSSLSVFDMYGFGYLSDSDDDDWWDVYRPDLIESEEEELDSIMYPDRSRNIAPKRNRVVRNRNPRDVKARHSAKKQARKIPISNSVPHNKYLLLAVN